MKSKYKIIIAALGGGLIFWVIDAVVDQLFLPDQTLLALLITHIPPHELYTRALVLIGILIASFVLITALTKRQRAEALAAQLNRMKEEQQRTTAALRQAHEVIERSPAVAFVWKNAETWPVTFVTENVEKLLGWTAADFLSGDRSYTSVIHPDDLERVADEVAQHSADSATTSFQHIPYRIIRRDGAVRWVGDLTYIQRDADDAVVAYEGILFDITPQKKVQDALRASEARYRLLFNSADALVSVYDQEGVCQLMNRKLAALFGGEPEDFIGQSFRDLHPEAGDAYIRRIRRAIKTGASQRYEDEVAFPLGKRWLLSTVHPVPNSQGEITTAQIISQDITERKETEEALAFQAMLLNHIQDHVTATDLDGTIIYVNDAEVRTLQRSREELLGSSVIDFGDDPARGATQQEIVTQTLKDGAWRGEVVNFTAGGDAVTLDVRTTLLKDANGRPTSMVGIATDITDQQRTQERLQESEERYRLLAETTPDIIALHDIEGRILYVNQAGLDFSGFTADEAPGKPVTVFIAPEHQAGLSDRRAQRVAGDTETYRYEIAFVNVAGERVPFEVYSKPIVRDDRVSEVLVVARDISERRQAEQILRESETRFRTLFMEAPDAIFLETLDDRILDANRAATQIFGYSREAFRAMTVADLQAPEVRGEPGTIVEAELAQGEVFETIDVRQDGTTVPVEVNNRRIRLNGQDVILSVVRDITVRRRAEEERELFKQAWDTASDAIGMSTPEGRHYYQNKTFDTMFGEVGDDVPSTLYVDQALGHAIFEGLKAGKSWAGEVAMYGRNGEILTILLRAYAVKREGQVNALVGIHTDITERVKASRERERLMARIRGQARQMEQILATVPTGVLLLNAAGLILRANPVVEEILARLSDPVEDRTLTHLGQRPLSELLTSPPTRGLWHEVKAGNRTFEVIARPVESGPEPELWVLVISDVTREREIRTQLRRQERLAAVGQLAAGIAHDFNNVMATIVLYAQMTARSKELSERGQERMAVIQEQAWHATRLIEQILDFSRRAVLERMPLNIVMLVKEHVKLLERTLPENIRIELSYERDEYTIKADPTRMQQVITNLAVNARDAMPDGGLLRITLEHIVLEPDTTPPQPEMKAGVWVKLAVADTGTGIAEEHLPHIFEPFFTTKQPGSGSGLGLAQVHGIVGLHDGYINVQSTVGEGTTFTIYLPALKVSPMNPSFRGQTAAEALHQGHGETILVVEDDAILRTALAEGLKEMNYRVIEAASGHRALDLLTQNDPTAPQIDLVLSDLVMPEMGGQALFHAMRQRGLTTPIVMLSGHPMEQEMEHLQAQGLAGWLRKPPNVAQLSQLLAQVLKTGDF